MASSETESSLLRGSADQRPASAAARLWLFARNFFKSPAMLGSVIPSSPFLVNDVLSAVDWERARVIVEFGPGVGTMTREILRRMHPEANLIAIELNPEFVRFLQTELADRRLRVVNASAAAVRDVLAGLGLGSADYIISGLPYTNMADSTRQIISEQSRAALHANGALLIYQFTGTILPYLQSSFSSVRQRFQPLNILPARIFHCTL
ncbi:MAG TPA: rRNA adenine N-6-methyltransferase family protein [Terriglobales bacterium]|nr:rRNA adenine N-6-methyltransferase family protein [Terriglobales bacterium]